MIFIWVNFRQVRNAGNLEFKLFFFLTAECSFILSQYVQEDTAVIFEKADRDNSGTLTVKEMQEVIDDVVERYPQVELYLKNNQMASIVDLLADAKVDEAKKSIELNIEEFKKALSHVDTQMKNLPATAQVPLQPR